MVTAHGITSWFLRQSKKCWKQARIIAKHHDDRWTRLISKWSPSISTKQRGYLKQGRPARRWEDDINSYLQPTKVHGGNNDLTNNTAWLTAAHDGLKLDSMDSYFCGQQTQTQTANKTHDPDRHDNADQPDGGWTNNTHDRCPPRRRRRHGTHPLPTNRKRILGNQSKNQQQSNTNNKQCSSDTL